MAQAARFLGFRRADGRFGTRNHVLILSIVGLANAAAERAARALKGAIFVGSPYGRGQYGPDQALHRAILAGLGSNPNIAATLVVGCDRKTIETVAHDIAKLARVDTAAMDDVHEDSPALSALALRKAARLIHETAAQRREEAPASALFLGVECGHSDATSGLIANPLAGKMVDRLIDAGGSAVIGEAIEWLGAEHIVAKRAATPTVAEAIVAAVKRREAAVAATGVDLTGNNPGSENIRGGLSTIEEKSLGAIAKTGSRPIQGVLAVGERPARPGLYLQDGPSFSPESLTGFVASGAQVTAFTTGAGNSYASLLTPTLKITGRPDTAQRLTEQIDFDGSAVFEGREDLDHAGDRLFQRLLDVASGAPTWGEILGEGGESFYRAHGSM